MLIIIYAPNIGESKYKKQKNMPNMKGIKGENDRNTVILRDLSH